MKQHAYAQSYKTAFVLILILIIVQSPQVMAYSTGIADYSGNPAHNSGAICTACHSGGAVPILAFAGPTTVQAGSTASYTLTMSGGQQNQAGFNLSADGGTLVDTNATGTTLHSNGAISHNQALNVGTGSVQWTFDWQAPTAPGNYIIYAAALSADGDNSSQGDNAIGQMYTITVAFDNTIPQAPIAKVGGPYVGAVDSAVEFDGSASTDLDGNIVRYLWDFGDNTAFGEGSNPSHTYTATGEYTVTLAVTDNDGLTGAAADIVTITTGLPPVADSGGPYSGIVNTSLQFDASASNDPDGTIVAYDWDFGDGNVGTGVSPTHTYVTAGNFDVSLTVTDNDGWSATTTTTAAITTNQGEQLYNANCLACHGAGGTGGSAAAIVDASVAQINNAIANIPAMGNINLSANEIQLIADYLAQGGGTPPPTTGEGLYNANCSACHGAGGAGGSAVAVIGASATQITNAITNIPAMGAINLSAADIQLIADYLATVAPPTTGKGLYDAYCASCHGPGGTGGSEEAVVGATAEEISKAIDSATEMNFLGGVLDSQQIQLIADYLNGDDNGGTTTPPPTTGQGLYDSNCAACHGAGGAGGSAVAVTGVTAAQINTAIANIGAMGNITLTAAEVQSIADYLNGGGGGSTPPPTTGQGLYDSNCAACHGAGGAGGSAIAVINATPTTISNAISNVGVMGGINLTTAEIQAISDYLSGGGGATKPTDGPGLYAAYCASCHGAGGSGGPEGGVLGASASKISSYINSEPAMQSLDTLLTNNDISLIADYLNGGSENGH